jgi:hypothetical protein
LVFFFLSWVCPILWLTLKCIWLNFICLVEKKKKKNAFSSHSAVRKIGPGANVMIFDDLHRFFLSKYWQFSWGHWNDYFFCINSFILCLNHHF